MNEKYTSMISPTLEELQSEGKYNRYELVIATSKCARIVTDEYVAQREHAEKMVANKETDKSIAALISREYRDEKAVRTAINRLHNKEYKIVEESLGQNID
ncbi:MAG: hypothetical protein E7574_03530 [Ruminococcaceae bacterium]|nr:hypothetical protein [Oscillospiraceae bacterium]